MLEGLQHAEVLYSEARKVLQNHDVCLSVKDYYNLKQLKKTHQQRSLETTS
jgi:hypothetical protein